MSYKIAVASADGENIDMSFGAATFFDIYEADKREYHFSERRYVVDAVSVSEEVPLGCAVSVSEEVPLERNVGSANSDYTGKCQSSCSTGQCATTCGATSSKVELICDCRCVLCKKIGFQAAKQLEKKAVTVFDVECGVRMALDKICEYFYKLDTHRSLRKN